MSQLRRLAWTITAWQESTFAGILAGISAGRTEGYNRFVKLVGRMGSDCATPTSTARRVR